MSGFRLILCFLSMALLQLALVPRAVQASEAQGAAAEKATGVGGVYYAEKYTPACSSINQKDAEEQHATPVLAYAFYDPDSEEHLCLNILSKGNAPPKDMIYRITDMNGDLLEPLPQPMTSSAPPLKNCSIMEIFFDDYNNDAIPDFTVMIGCLPVANETNARHDNVFYFSSVRDGMIWMRQYERINETVASLRQYSEVKSTIMTALSKSQP